MKELYAEHPVMFKNNPIGFIASILLVPVFGIGLLILLYWHLMNKSSKLTVTENEILYEEGLLSKTRSEINMESVRTIRVSQTFFQRIFGVGSVEIFTAGDNAEILAKGLPDPNKVRELVKMGQTDEA